MKVAIILCVAMCACANAGVITPIVAPTTLVRTPAHDSAVIKSDRLGGNFAYSTAEAHAYAQITPVVQNVVEPVAVSYNYNTHVVPSVAVGYAPAVVHAPLAVGVAPVPIASPIGIAHPGFSVIAQDAPLSAVEAAPVAPLSPEVAADDSVAVDSV